MLSRSFRPITYVLIQHTLGWALLCSLAFASLQAWMTYREAQEDFRVAVRQVANTHVPMLALAIWDIEPQAIQHQIDLILESPQIGHVMLKTYTGQSFEAGTAQADAENAPVVFSIPHPNTSVGSLGSLTLVADRSVLYRDVLHSVGIAMAQCLVLTLLLIGTVVVVLRRDLEAPMRALAGFVSSLQVNNLSTALAVKRKDGPRYDEIDLVLNAIETLQASIHGHIETLDNTVRERTQQLEVALDSLKTLSSMDALTACFNRRSFDERFATEISRTNRYDHPLCVVFCDVDRFKSINDRHGHAVGDQVLVQLVAQMQTVLRDGVDWMARYGGEEFVVVLPETVLSEALVLAERLRQAVEAKVQVPLKCAQPLRVTASFGVAQWQAGEEASQLLQRADECMYFAQEQGRNQVQPASESQSLMDQLRSASTARTLAS